MSAASNEPLRVEIVYNGPVGTHLVPSPTRKVANYGLHTRGDEFLVHVADQEQSPTKFVLKNPPVAVVVPPVPQQTVLPPAPEKVAVKAPEPIAEGAFVTKEVVEEEIVEAAVEDAPAKAKAPTTKAKPIKESK